VVFVPLLAVTGLDRRSALETSTILAQVSEFCLVMAYLGAGLGHIDGRTTSVVIFAFIATALITPTLVKVSEHVHRFVDPWLRRLGLRAAATTNAESVSEHPRLVFLGFHRIASALLHDLSRDHPEVLPHTLIVDFNVKAHAQIAASGVGVTYGDVASVETLRHVGVAGAEIVVSTVPDELLKGTTNLGIVRAVRKLNPDATVIAHASSYADVPALWDAGARYVFSWRVETSRGVLPAIFAALNGNLDEFLEARRLEVGKLADRREALE
jgi:hypothetical protein